MRQAPIRTTRKISPARRKGRSRLLGGASALAAAVMLLVAPQQASAQIAVTGRAFEANPVGATGVASITRTDTLDTVQIAGPEAVITWRPIDTATSSAVIDILPVGNTLAFTGDGAYTVLNRVIPDDPTRAIQFNGTVFSLNGGALGGNIWFYSPGGIIAGPSSVFLVGGLVLTSSNLTGIDKGGTELNFLGAAANSAVTIQPGARLLSGNYVVLWAPRVVQGGGVAAGGNVSYVGAESGILTVTGGLFDMVINVGTDDPNGVVHTGITTGPTPVDNPPRAITMATVAKNDFVNMLVGGTIGYADASVATAGNGIIVLSAANGTQPNSGNITIGPAVLNSTTLATASGDLTIALNGQSQALNIGSATNEADFFGLAGRNLTINATSGATVNAVDNFFALAASPGQGGTLTVNIDDAGRDNDSSFSGLLVGGNLTLSTFGNGVDNIPLFVGGVTVSPTFGGDGNGGTINVNVSQGGELFVGGTTLFSAAGTAGFGGLFSGDATGGAINFTLNGNNSRVQLGGDALFDVSANRSAPGPVNAGGSVDAGSINLTLNSGSFSFANLTMTANADADDSLNATGRPNGARGGTVTVSNTARLTGTGLAINALGLGGGGGTSATASDAGGDGSGGTVSLTNGVGGSLTLTTLGINVSGSGGQGGNGADLIAGARGGAGAGGELTVTNRGTLTGDPLLTLNAAGTGGNGGTGGATPNDFDPAAVGGAGGGGFGGTINLVADGATLAAQIGPTILASGTGGTGGTGGAAPSFIPGAGGQGGDAQGGEFYVAGVNGGSLQLTTTTGATRLDAGAAGGAGGGGGIGASALGNPGPNGAALGGNIELFAGGGAITIGGSLIADVAATGNQDLRANAVGADATGGVITTNVATGGSLTVTGGLWLDATALAAIGEQSAGTGRGGTVNMLMTGTGSLLDIQGVFPPFFTDPPSGRSLYIDASAYEPQSGSPLLQTASGGDTFGGTVNISFADGGSTIAGQTQVLANAGRNNPLSGPFPASNLLPGPGTATGGDISVTLTNGTHQWNSFDATLDTYAPGSTANDGTIRVLLDNATLNAGVGFSFSTTVFGNTTTNLADVISMRVINGSSLTTTGFTAFYTEAVQGPSSTPVTTGNILLEVDGSTINSDIFYTSIVPNRTGTLATGGTMGLSATNGSTINGDVNVNIFAGGGTAPGGSSSRSGEINYLLDGSTHTGNLTFFSFGEGVGGTGPGDPGGQAIGGNQNLTFTNGASFTGDVTLSTFLDSSYSGPEGGELGDIDGGTFSLTIDGSTVDIGVLDVSFVGGAGTAADGVAGANISATDFALNVTGSQVTIGDATIDLGATGGRGGENAAGGIGTGGHILVTSDATSALVLNDISFITSGTGGRGGNLGGSGGTGVGGSIGLFTLGDLELNTYNATSIGTGGLGGSGDFGLAGGDGGFGQGGEVELEFSAATGVNLILGNLSLDSSAFGGAGGAGGDGISSGDGANGGSGGSAAGGLTRFRVTGAGANLVFDPLAFNVASSALGGTGGAGGGSFGGGTAGAGGDGGAGTGGTIALEAGSGATLSLQPVSAGPFQLQVNGTGGDGGAGGSIDMISGGTAGAGGNGGQGTGGSPTLRAVGGLIRAGEIDIRATGIGGTGGIGGTDGTVTLGAVGNGGNGFGGTPVLETLDGSPGRLTLDTVVIDASGIGGSGTFTGSSGGGQITITDGSAEPGGLITMGSLTVTATGPLTPPGTASLTIEGASGPITVIGDVNATVAGDINLVFDGNGRLAVGGTTTLGAGGNITLAHTGNTTGVFSLNSGTDLIATAGGNFIAGAGSIINAGRDVSITAQNIQFASIAAVRDLLLAATNGDITAVGAAGLVAGRVLDLDATQAIAIGDVESDLSIALTAGTTVSTGDLTSTGTDTLGDQRIDIVAGGDVSLGTVDAIDALTVTGARLAATSLDGESVSATMTGAIAVGSATAEATIALSGTAIVLDNGDAPGNITLDATAGSIALGTINSETDLVATATGDIAFTGLTGRIVTLDAGGSIAGDTVAADRAVTSGMARNVNLTAVGDIAVTSASATDNVVVRGASLTATSITSGTGINANIDVLVGGAIDIGSTSSGGQTVLTGSSIILGSGVAGLGTSVLTSTTGAIDLGTFDSEEFLDLVSATTVTFDTLTARALSIDAVGDVTGTSAAADLALASGRPRNVSVTTDGAVNIGQLAAVDSVVVRGASLTSTSITSGTGINANIDVLVGGAIDIGSTSSGGQTVLTGSSIILGSGVAGLGTSVLTATTGGVDLGTFDSDEFLDIVSATTVDFVTLTARALSIDAVGDVTGTSAAADLALASGRPRNVSVTTDGAVNIGQLAAVDSVVVRGASLTSTSITSGTGINANIDVLVGGVVDIGSTSSGGQTVLTGSSITLGTGVAGAGASVLTSTAGDVSLTTFDSENFLDIVSAGSVTFDTLTARALSIDSQSNVTGTRAAADVNLASGRSRDVSITAVNAVSVDQLAAVDNVAIDAFTLNTLNVAAGGDLLATLVGVGNLTSITTGGSATISGSSLVIGDGVSGGLALLTATVGDVDLGTWDAQGFFDIDAAGTVNFDRVTGRLVEIIAGGDITGNFAASDVNLASGRPRNVTLDAGGVVTIGEARSIGNVLLDGASVDAGIVNAAGTGTFTATGLVAIADLTTGSATGITAGSADIGTASTALFTANTTGAFAIDGLVTNGAAADASITAGGAITLGTIQGSRIVRLNGASITGGTISAVGSIDLDGGSVTLDRVASSNGVITIDTTVGGISVDDLDATAFGIRINSAADFDSLTIDAGGLIQIVADGNATLGTGNAGSSISVNAGGNITSGNLFAGTTSPGITLTAGGAATLANLTTNGLINVNAGGALTGGLFSSAGQITLRGSLIDITSAIASGVGGIAATSTAGNIAADLLRTASLSIVVASTDAAAIGAIEAGSSARVTTVNDATLGPVTATSGQVALDIGGNLTAGNIFGGAASPPLDINVGGNAQLASVTSGGLLDIDAGGDLTADVLQANGGLTVDAASIAITSANSDTFGVGLRSTVGGVTADLLTAAGNLQVASATGATLGALDSGANIDVTAGGTSRLGTATADGNLTVTVTGNLTTGALTAGATPTSILDLNVTGNALVASAQSGFILDVDVSGALTGGTFASGATTIDAGSVNVTRVAGTAGGGVIVNATTGNALIGTVDSGGNARITALAGAARVGTLNAALLGEMIGRSVTLNTATVGGNLRLQATAGNVAGTGVIDVTGAIDLDATGDITFGTLVAQGGAFTADAGGDLTFTGASASDLLAFNAGGAVTGGNLSADLIALSAGGAASLGNLSANGTITVGTGRALTAGDIATIVSGANNSIALTSGGAMTLGDVTSGEGLSMIAGGALTLGTASTLNSDAASTILARGTGVTADLLATRLNSGAGVTVDARTGLADIGRIQAGGTSSVSGGSIALDSVDVRGNLRLLATSGGIVATGLLDVRGAADFDAAGPVTLTTLLGRAQIAIDTPGLLSFDRIANPGNNGGTIRLAAGSVQGGDLGTNVSGADDSIFVTTTGDLALATVTSGQAITLAAGGALTLGSAQTLNSDAASFIAITGGSVDAGSLATMVNSGANVSVTATAGAASLGTVTAGGNVTMSGETIALATGDIRGGLSLTSTVGDIALAPDGAGQIVVGGPTNLTSAGSILLTHTNNTGGLVSLASTGNIVAQADNGITSAAGSILSGNEVFILAGRDVDLADVRAVPGLVITAGGSVALANAAVTGPRGGSDITGIQIDAGLDPRGSSGYDSLGNVSITGSISSYSDIVINAGGTTAFAAGSQSLAGNGILVRTGDDIIVGAGALLQSARDNSLTFDPANPFGRTGSIDLHAGGLTPLFSTPLTPIASLVVDGSINAGRGAVIARANAIDGIDGAFAGSSLSFDIDNAPPAGAVLSDDNGLLTAPCLEGNVCLGSVAASNLLFVGQSSPADVLALTIQQGTVNAREIRIATRNDIVMGTSGIATTLNASDVFTATSRAGDVDLRDSTISSNLIRIEAAGSLLGSASLTSAGDVGITVGDSLFAGTISAGGELTTAAGAGGAREGTFSVPGTLAVGTLSLGAGAVNYTAGTIDIGSLAVAGTDVRLVATGPLSLGQTSGAASLDLAGGSVLGGDLLASGDIAILSGSDVELTSADAGGSVAIDLAGDLSFGLVQAGGDILVNAGGAANGGDLDAQGAIALDAARIAVGSASGNSLSLTSATDVLFDFLTSPNSISITATAGRIGGNTTAGLIETDGDLTLRARTIDLRDLAAGGTLDIAVTGTALTLGRLDAGADIVLGSAGSIFVDHADAVGNFTANSVRGFSTGPNSIVTGGDILIGAGGPVDLGNSSAGGLIDVSGTQIDFASLVAGTTMALSTVASSPTAGGNGNITGGSLQAGAGSSSLVTTAGDIVLSGNASVSGGLSLTANGGDINLTGLTSAGGLLSLASSGTIATGNLASATGDVQADAGLGITVADVTAANDVRLAATSGNVGFGALSAGRDVNVAAAGNITGLSIDAGRDGDLQADSDSSGVGDLTLIGRARAVRDLALLGANISLADVVVTGVTPAPSNRLSGFVTINSTNGSLLVGDVTAPGMTLVSEGGDLVAGNLNAFDPVLAFGLPTVIDVSAFGGDITIASLNTVGDVALFNADGTLTRVLGATNAGNDVFFSGAGEFRFDGAVTAGRDLIGRANGSTGAGVTFGAGLDIGRNADVRARDGAIFLLPGLLGPSTIGGNLTFTARQIGLSAVDVGGSLALTATGGSIDATEVGTVGGAIALLASDDVTFGSLSAGGGSFLVDAGGSIVFEAAQSSDTITMTAAGDLAGGDLAAPGLVSLDAARIVIGDATAGSFAIASGSDILFDSLSSDSSVDLVAANGRIGAHTGPGDLTSGGNITLLAQEIALGTIDALGNVTGTTNLGAMDFARVLSGGAILLDSAGSIAVGHAEAAGNFTATAGLDFATGPDSILTGGDIVIDAGGTVALGNSSADGLIAVTGQQIDFDTLTAGSTVSLRTVLDPQAALRGNGNIAGQSITAGVGDSLISARDGGDIAIAGTITADAVQVVANAGAITSGGLNTRLFAILNAAGAITLTGNSVGTNTFFADGASIALGSSSISNGNVTMNARNGDVTGTGRIDANGELVVNATRTVSLLGDLVSASATRIDGNSIALGNAASAGSISLRAATGGIGSTGTISAGRDISVDSAGGAVLNELVAGDDVFFNGSGDISIANLLVTGDNPAGEEIGSNGTFTIDGSVFVDHAEIADNLTANVTGGFATGPSSIIAGGNIVIDAGGPVALGNSSAGGLVDVTGSQIDFSTLAAGQTVTLLTQPSSQTGSGNGNITGTDLAAGAGASSVTSTFGAVAIGGQTTVAGSLAVGASQGITLGTVAVQGGDLAATAGGSIALGSASASGNVRLAAGGSITATGDITARGTLTLLAQTGAIAARDLIASGLTATAAGPIGVRDVLLSGGGASLTSGGAVALRDLSGAGASGVSITADGNLGFDDIVSAGGVSLLARNGAIDGVNIASGGAVSASGQTVGLGTVAASGDVVAAAQTGALVAGSVSSSAGGVALQGATAVDVATLAAATNATVQGGQVTVGTADAGGDIALTSGAGDGISAGALTAGGSIAASAGIGGFAGTTLDAGGDVALGSAAGIAFDTIGAAGAVDLVSTGAGAIAGQDITAGTSISASTDGTFAAGLVAASRTANGQVNINATNGISIGQVVGTFARLAASGGQVNVTVDIDVAGFVSVLGQSARLRSTHDLTTSTTATAGDIDIEISGNLDATAVAQAGNVRLVSTAGDVLAADVSAAETSSGTGGNITIEAFGDLRIEDDVVAANALELVAGGEADIRADAVGRDISLRASDVAITSTGALGRLDATRSVTISGGSVARIGGADGTDQGFVIDNDEFARIQASELIGISASTAIILDQLDIRVANASSSTGNVRGEGRVSFSAAEGIEVIGEVVMTGATADNALALATAGDVFLDASTGLLEINDGAGNYLGLIEIEASNFYAMTEQARADVEAAASIDAIEDRLAQNDGIDNPDGLIRTGTLDITTIASDVFIQNTAPGTRFEDRRGFTVDELLISDPGGTNQPIVINGIIAGATGIDAVPLAQISSSFDPGSTINGCLISNPSNCVQIPEHLGEGTFPVQDLIEEELEEDETSEPGLESGVLDTPLFELKDPLDSVEDPLLDDPVTGAGNEDLWVGEQPEG